MWAGLCAGKSKWEVRLAGWGGMGAGDGTRGIWGQRYWRELVKMRVCALEPQRVDADASVKPPRRKQRQETRARADAREKRGVASRNKAREVPRWDLGEALQLQLPVVPAHALRVRRPQCPESSTVTGQLRPNARWVSG